MTLAPTDNAEALADLARGLKLIAKRAEHYKEARAYYEGTAQEIYGSKIVQKALEAEQSKHPLSLAHVPCDAVHERVALASIKAENAAANERLTDLLDELDLLEDAEDVALKALMFGDYYLVVNPEEETDDDEPVATRLSYGGCSPLTTVMIYGDGSDRAALYGVRRWKVGDGDKASWRAAVYYDDATLLFRTGPGVKEEAKVDEYRADVDEDGSNRVDHAGGRKLLVHYPVFSRPYGTPAHVRAYAAQDAITKISATNLAAVEGQGFPFRYFLLDPMAEADDDLDSDFGDDGPDTTSAGDGLTTPTTGQSRVKPRAGAAAILRGVKSVGQLEAADSDNFLANLDWYVRAMAVATGTPLFEFDMSGEQPSGEARRRAAARVNRRAQTATRYLGQAHRTLIDTMLATIGLDPVKARVTVSWLPTEMETDADGVELIGAKILNGIPVKTALLEAGYTEEQVAEWYPEDAKATPALAQALGLALKDLGTAQTLGAITAAEVRDLLPQFLTAARSEGVAAALEGGAPAPTGPAASE